MVKDDDTIKVEKARSNKNKNEDGSAGKKRKASNVIIHQDTSQDNNSKRRKSTSHPFQEEPDLDTSRPTAIFKPKCARDWTVSIALPGSWLNNARKPDHKTLQVGRIARAAAVFCVDEIVVYDDDPIKVDHKVVNDRYIRAAKGRKSKQEILDSILEDDEPWQNPDQFLYHVLSFAECPPHLRMGMFAKHKNLEQAGLLPSMDMPHHLKREEWCRYREGVIVDVTKGKEKNTYVEVGLPYPICITTPVEAPLEQGMRTTIRFQSVNQPDAWPHLSQAQCEALDASPCTPALPREQGGYYWGYTVRRAASISKVLTECEFQDGYDYTIGTSERGIDVNTLLRDTIHHPSNNVENGQETRLRPFKHLLLVFGGVAGIEPAVANDPELTEKGLGKNNASELFDVWVNLVTGQGSRTIRTEEAVEFGLCALKPWVDSMYGKSE